MESPALGPDDISERLYRWLNSRSLDANMVLKNVSGAYAQYVTLSLAKSRYFFSFSDNAHDFMLHIHTPFLDNFEGSFASVVASRIDEAVGNLNQSEREAYLSYFVDKPKCYFKPSSDLPKHTDINIDMTFRVSENPGMGLERVAFPFVLGIHCDSIMRSLVRRIGERKSIPT